MAQHALSRSLSHSQSRAAMIPPLYAAVEPVRLAITAAVIALAAMCLGQSRDPALIQRGNPQVGYARSYDPNAKPIETPRQNSDAETIDFFPNMKQVLSEARHLQEYRDRNSDAYIQAFDKYTRDLRYLKQTTATQEEIDVLKAVVPPSKMAIDQYNSMIVQRKVLHDKAVKNARYEASLDLLPPEAREKELLHKRIEELEQRVEELEDRLNDHEGRLNEAEYQLEDQEFRLSDAEDTLDDVKNDLDAAKQSSTK